MKEVTSLENSELISRAVSLRGREKEILYSLLLYLGEIDARKLYRDEGYSSFFSYLTISLGYSNASAQRRVEAARFLRKRPELYSELTSGKLSFSALVELSKCAERDNLSQLVEKSSGKSHKAVAELVQKEIAPVVPLKRKERVRVVKCEAPKALPMLGEPNTSASEVNYQIVFQVDEEFMRMYREAKPIAGGDCMKGVFAKLLKDFTQRKSPKERMKRREKRGTAPTQTKGRHIAQAVKDEVYVRDGGRCTYVAPSGTRCSCTENLEYDHVVPYSLGGVSSTENLRLLCRSHNQLMAEQALGKSFMKKFQLREALYSG